MDNARIIRVEKGVLAGQRPRKAGSNARLGEHGLNVQVHMVRLTTDDGTVGFAPAWPGEEQAQTVLGQSVDQLFSLAHGTNEEWLWLDYPLWDLAAKRIGQPIYELAAAITGHSTQECIQEGTYRAPCYDTALYFDDLHLESEAEAAGLIAAEAAEDFALGHRAFKIKVGRGAMHMPLEAGTRRDIAVIKAVRAAVGPECPIMLDANNGYNLNLTKRVLEATAECGIFWMEEPFQEDPTLYKHLKEWMAGQGLKTLIADGEGWAPPSLLRWAKEGLVDVIQYDIFSHGFTRWLATGRQLDEWGVRSAPHHYGGHYGNFAACHLAGAIQGFTYVEFDDATTPGLDTSGYTVRDGLVQVPSTPGFGMDLDETLYQRAVQENGFRVSL